MFKGGRKAGEGVFLYGENGGKRFFGGFKRDLKEGWGVRYYEAGGVAFEGGFMGDVKHGSDTVSFYENGNVKMRGGYDKGLRVGLCKKFYKGGQLDWLGRYKGGEDLSGVDAKYFKGGKLRYRSTGADPNRFTVIWSDNGQMLYVGKISGEVPRGDSIRV